MAIETFTNFAQIRFIPYCVSVSFPLFYAAKHIFGIQMLLTRRVVNFYQPARRQEQEERVRGGAFPWCFAIAQHHLLYSRCCWQLIRPRLLLVPYVHHFWGCLKCFCISRPLCEFFFQMRKYTLMRIYRYRTSHL